jgi:hypothetical protein
MELAQTEIHSIQHLEARSSQSTDLASAFTSHSEMTTSPVQASGLKSVPRDPSSFDRRRLDEACIAISINRPF